MKWFLGLTALCLSLHTLRTEAADFRAYKFASGSGDEVHLVLEGAIEIGDDQKLIDTITAQKGATITTLNLFSTGGAVPAAMTIIDIVRRNLIHVRAPAVLESSSGEFPSLDTCTNPGAVAGYSRPYRQENCICASACGFIWLAAQRRSGTEIYLHRPYFDPNEYKSLPLKKAQEVYNRSTAETRKVLGELEIPPQIVEKALSRGSLEFAKLSADDRRLVGEFSPAIEELLIARCSESAAKWQEWAFQWDRWQNEWSGQKRSDILRELYRQMGSAAQGRLDHNECRNREFLKLQQEAQQLALGIFPEQQPAPQSPPSSCEGRVLSTVAGEKRCLKPGDTFRDCDACPEMVVIPAGKFTMGSPAGEKGRGQELQHEVTIAKAFAVGKFEVTRGQFAFFASDSGHDAGNKCWTYEEGVWDERPGRSFRKPGYEQTDQHPVACVNWPDAVAYAGWMAKRTGEGYRLLTEAEWEYAARAGSGTRFHFGDDDGGLCDAANGADRTAESELPKNRLYNNCTDGFVFTAPVGSFAANRYALNDMHGNVWEWVEDCYRGNYWGGA